MLHFKSPQLHTFTPGSVVNTVLQLTHTEKLNWSNQGLRAIVEVFVKEAERNLPAGLGFQQGSF